MLKKETFLQYQDAIAFLVKAYESNDNEGKPELFHALYTGMKLIEFGYSGDTVIAGFLHDIIEESDITKDNVQQKFGNTVADIVAANTKDLSIEDKKERYHDIVKRCKHMGKEACLVKAADILSNFYYYSAIANQEEIELDTLYASIVFEHVTYDDPIFQELKNIGR